MPQHTDDEWFAVWDELTVTGEGVVAEDVGTFAREVRAELLAEIDTWVESTIGCEYSTPSQDLMHRWMQRKLNQLFKP